MRKVGRQVVLDNVVQSGANHRTECDPGDQRGDVLPVNAKRRSPTADEDVAHNESQCEAEPYQFTGTGPRCGVRFQSM